MRQSLRSSAVWLETGVALQYPDGSKDPTIDGALANGMVLLHGPIARCLMAALLMALAISMHRTEACRAGWEPARCCWPW